MSTKSWSTSFFLIRRRVFQGDTFSPLVCFNPIVKLANSLKDEGFSLCLPVPNSEGLPPIGHCTHFTQRALRCFAPSNFSKSQHSKLIKRLARTVSPAPISSSLLRNLVLSRTSVYSFQFICFLLTTHGTTLHVPFFFAIIFA